jgi:hypothetical protein
VTDDTFAGIEQDGILTGGHDLTLHADGRHAMTTEAKIGAAGGGIAITPAIAVAISNVTSKADIGSGLALSLTGKLDAKAELTASAVTSASGSATTTGSAAIGVALALTIAEHSVESLSLRNVTAVGDARRSARRPPRQRPRPPQPGRRTRRTAGRRTGTWMARLRTSAGTPPRLPAAAQAP